MLMSQISDLLIENVVRYPSVSTHKELKNSSLALKRKV
jgi:hypothetical protein